MGFRDYFAVLRRYWLVIVLVTGSIVGVTAYVSANAEPLYRSSAAIYLIPNGETPNELSQGSKFVEDQLDSYAQLAATSTVLDPVIEELGLNTTARALAGSVDASVKSGSVIVTVTAVSADPALAAQVADATAASLSVQITELAPVRPDGTSSVTVSPVEQATVPTSPFAPNTSRNVTAALVSGLIIGYLLALAWSLLDTRLRTSGQVRDVVGASVLSEVPSTRSTKIGANQANWAYVESFRRLQANLDFVDVGERPLQLVVTSSVAGEGKSTTSLNLALVCAEAGQKVLLVDGDLRRPNLHKMLGLEPSVGLSTVLAGKSSLDDAVISVGRGTTIDVLCSGLLPPNPTELLASSAMDDMLAEAKRKFDIVVIDMPPVVPVVEGLVVARKVNGALLVSRLGKGRRDQLKAAADRFHDANAAILGIVVNGTDHSARSSYYYGSDVGSNGKPKPKPKRGRSQRGKAKKSAAQTSSAVQGNSAKNAPQGAGLARHTPARPPTSPQGKLS